MAPGTLLFRVVHALVLQWQQLHAKFPANLLSTLTTINGEGDAVMEYVFKHGGLVNCLKLAAKVMHFPGNMRIVLPSIDVMIAYGDQHTDGSGVNPIHRRINAIKGAVNMLKRARVKAREEDVTKPYPALDAYLSSCDAALQRHPNAHVHASSEAGEAGDAGEDTEVMDWSAFTAPTLVFSMTTVAKPPSVSQPPVKRKAADRDDD